MPSIREHTCPCGMVFTREIKAGRQPVFCRPCALTRKRAAAAATARKLRADDPVAAKQAARINRARHRDENRLAFVRWREQNPDAMRALKRKYYARHRAAILEAGKTPEGRARGREYNSRRRARERGVEFEPVDHLAVFERDRWICGLCDSPVDAALSYPDPASASLDHVVPLSRGGAHVMSNVQLAHLLCNLRKGVKAA